jgi:hypothetical protein
MEHLNTQINEIVVMYLSVDKVIRPPVPPDVSVCKGIMSCFSFLFVDVPKDYVRRLYSSTVVGQVMLSCVRSRT